MAVSFRQTDSRVCTECRSGVESEIWLILHRLERPLLWDRCCDGSIHHARCRRGHVGNIRAPLLLYDPRLDFAIYSPAPMVDDRQARAEGDPLMERLRASVSAEERDRALRKIEIIPREALGGMLLSPRLNIQDFAPGADPNRELEVVYQILRLGDFDSVLNFIENENTPLALRAALRFEAGMRFNRMGDRSDDVFDQAIRHFHAALDFYTRDRFSHRWAAIHSELALSFRYRTSGSRANNLREAIRCSDAALEVFQLDTYPEDYAITQSNRAAASIDAKLDRSRSIEVAIEAYREALRVYDQVTYPEGWAGAQSDLATVLIERGRPRDIQDAADALQKAISIQSKKRSPRDRAIAQMNLGLVLRRLSKKSSGAAKQNAIQALREAYQVLRRHGSAHERLAIAYDLGSALVGGGNLKDFPEAARLLEQSRTAMLDMGDYSQLDDCTSQLAELYFKWAHQSPDRRSDICANGLRALEGEQDSERTGLVFHELARLLSDSAEANDWDLAVRAARRALSILRTKTQAEYRAKALTNLGRIYLRQSASARALSCFDAALRIFQKLQPTPERTEAIGRLHVLSAGAGARRRVH
jgi:tetratricopeptide (TPR) repeat protein